MVSSTGAKFAAPFATIHNYNNGLSGFARELQNKQFTQAVATPINFTKFKKCSASSRLFFGSKFIHLLLRSRFID